MQHSSIERISGIVLLIISIGLLFEVSGPQYGVSAVDEGVNPGFLPKILLSIWLVLALILIFRPRRDDAMSSVFVEWRKFATFSALIIGYFIAVWFIGFISATGIFLCLGPIFLNFRPVWGSLVFGAVATAALWFIFEKIFQLVLPVGLLLE